MSQPSDCPLQAAAHELRETALDDIGLSARAGVRVSKLHPQIQRRFGFHSQSGIAAVGTGVMDEVWHGAPYTLPFLYVGTWRSIMFPKGGRNVPFTIQNYAYLDSLRRETVTWVRTFETSKRRRFDAYMIFSEERLYCRLSRHTSASGRRY